MSESRVDQEHIVVEVRSRVDVRDTLALANANAVFTERQDDRSISTKKAVLGDLTITPNPLCGSMLFQQLLQ